MGGFLTTESGSEYFVNIKDVENQVPLQKEEPVDFFLENQTDGRERAMKVRSLQPQQHPQQPLFAAPPAAGFGAGFAPPAAAYGFPPQAFPQYQAPPVSNIPGAVYSGVCKWYNAVKGFGFITPNDGTAELYFKGTDIQGGGSLEQGEPVRYEAKHQEGKSWAVN